MSNKEKMAELNRRAQVLEAAIKAAKEKKAVKEAAARKTSISYLIESEMEKAEVIMVAKSVVQKLQKSAEDLAKIEGTDIMPAMEALKTAFGVEQATAFQQAVSEQLRNAVNALTAAKDSIGQHVNTFEGNLEGETTNDMATMDDGMGAAAPADPMADPMAAPAAPAPEGDAALAADPMADPAAAAPEGDAALADVGELDGMFNDVGTDTAAGRPKKESFAHAGAKALSESKNPDAMVLSAFRRLIAENAKPVPAAKAVANHFGIDFADVVAIVQETRLGK
jgi:hypothetical protein